MKIKDIDLGKHPILLAPMEDVTDPAFRLMCKGFGADMVYTEFVSSDALIRSVSKTEQKLNISDEERPVAIQIYGKDTDTMVGCRQQDYRGLGRATAGLRHCRPYHPRPHPRPNVYG